jgi:transposase
VDKLLELAALAESMPSDFSILSMKIKFHLDGIENLKNSLDSLIASASQND